LFFPGFTRSAEKGGERGSVDFSGKNGSKFFVILFLNFPLFIEKKSSYYFRCMATPRNHLEIILIDRGFSRVNEKRFKKIYIPIYSAESVQNNSCSIDVEAVEALTTERQNLYDSFSSINLSCSREKNPKQDYFARLRKIYHSFGSTQNSGIEFENETLYLFVDSLPQSVREIIFDDKKFDVENWDSLNEGIMWLSWLRTIDIAPDHRESRQMAEYMNVLKSIRGSCLSRKMILEALYMS
jgi:hypothetical protein